MRTVVFKNIMNVLGFQVPDSTIAHDIVDPRVRETWCGVGTNGSDWVAAARGQETATVAEVSEYYLGLDVYRDVEHSFRCFHRGVSFVE